VAVLGAGEVVVDRLDDVDRAGLLDRVPDVEVVDRLRAGSPDASGAACERVTPSLTVVRWCRPMIMSCVGRVTGRPTDGIRMLLEASIRMRPTASPSTERGRCKAIWSPSKTALNAAHTSGCRWKA
jgi:hypothetical protein